MKKHLFIFFIACLFTITASAQETQSFKFQSSGTKFKLGDETSYTGEIKIFPSVMDADNSEITIIQKGLEYEIVANQGYTVSSDFSDLGLQSNYLTSLDVSNLTNLKKLDCSYNQLTSLDASNLTNLKMLFCSYNRLTSLDVSHLTNLERLSCFYNQLTSLDVSHLTNLERLSCDYNRLTSLDVSNLTKLEILNCRNNQMLDIINNNTPSNVGLIGGNQTVVILMKENEAGGYISTNSYTIAEGHSLNTPSTMTFVGGYFKCTELPSGDVAFSTSLGWEDNKELEGKLKFSIKQPFKFTSSGTKFELGSNSENTENITITPAVKDVDGLQTSTIKKGVQYEITANQEYIVISDFLYLGLQSNQLTSLDVSNLTNLESLTCYYNQLANLDVSSLINLEVLLCYNNQLTSLDVSNLTKLKNLYCSNNLLTSLDVSNLTKLETLSCGSNQMLDIKNANTPLNVDLKGGDQTIVILMKENEAGGYISTNSYTIAEGHSLNTPSTITFEGGYFKCIQLPGEDVTFSTSLGWEDNKELEGKLKFSIKQPFEFTSSGTKFELGIHTENTENITITPAVKDVDGLQTSTIKKGVEYEITANQEYTVISDFLELRLESNFLTSVDVSNLTNLEKLYCSNNQLPNLDVSNLTNLKTLFCIYNQLPNLDISKLINLKSLFCYNNQLTSLDVSNLTKLKNLYCSNNLLTSLDVSNLTKLETLSCGSNQMLDIKNANTPLNVDLKGGDQTIVILMKENEAGGYISTNSYTIAEGHSLNTPSTITFEGGYFKCIQLPGEDVTFSTSLGWEDNKELEGKLKFSIKQPFKFTSSGTKFELGSNSDNTENITITPAVKDVDGLQTNTIKKGVEYEITANQEYTVISDFLYLGLRSNQLTSLDVSNLTNLKGLSCDYNSLTSLDVSNLTNLKGLSFIYNGFTNLDISNLTNLEVLYCYGNQLTSLDVSNLTKLETLSCGSNQMLDIKNANTPLNVDLRGYDQTVVIPMKANLAGGYISENSYTIAEGHSLDIPSTITFEGGYFKCTELPSEYVTFSTSLGWDKKLEGKLKFEGVVQQFTLGLIASPAEGGTVFGAGTYNENTDVTAKATANAGFTFSGWFDGDNKVSEELEYKFKLTKNINLIAKFTQSTQQFTLGLIASPAEGGTVFGAGTYNENTDVTAKATANAGFTFSGWFDGDNKVSEELEYKFKLTKNINLIAKFTQSTQQFTLGLIASPADGGAVFGEGTYNANAEVAAKATANAGFSFSGWFDGDNKVSEELEYKFKLTKNTNLIAKFTKLPQQFTLALSASPTDGGTVSGEGTYNENTEVTAKATANSGFSFSGWFDGDSKVSEELEYKFKLIKNTNLIAKFEKKITPISVSISGKKNITGNIALKDQQFEFELYNDNTLVKSAKNNAEGKFILTISDLTEGTYNYTLKEKNDNQTGYTYDTKVYAVSIIVSKNTTNDLTHVITIKDGENIVETPEFTNSYKDTGISEFNADSQIKLYPNPVNDVLQIESLEIIKEITLSDISGKILITQLVNETHFSLSTAQFKAGVYIVRLRTAKGLEYSKIIKE